MYAEAVGPDGDLPLYLEQTVRERMSYYGQFLYVMTNTGQPLRTPLKSDRETQVAARYYSGNPLIQGPASTCRVSRPLQRRRNG